jgi:hypothetical protein
MELILFKTNGLEIAEVVSDEVVINTPQDALDIMANAYYQGARQIILYEKNIMPEFFDLKTGLAGEILQKYSNYQMKLAIVGDFEKFESKSLKAFISESNRGKQIAFVATRQAALEKITS